MVIPSSSRIHARSQPSITFLNPGNLTGPLPSQAHLRSSWCMYILKHHNKIYLSRALSIYPSIRAYSVGTSSTSPILYAFSKSPFPNYHRSNPQRLGYMKKREEGERGVATVPLWCGSSWTYFWKVQTTSTLEGGATSTCVFDVSFFPSSCTTFIVAHVVTGHDVMSLKE